MSQSLSKLLVTISGEPDDFLPPPFKYKIACCRTHIDESLAASHASNKLRSFDGDFSRFARGKAPSWGSSWAIWGRRLPMNYNYWLNKTAFDTSFSMISITVDRFTGSACSWSVPTSSLRQPSVAEHTDAWFCIDQKPGCHPQSLLHSWLE